MSEREKEKTQLKKERLSLEIKKRQKKGEKIIGVPSSEPKNNKILDK